jgi:dTDP-4-dehydrorhamnose reductase
LRILYLGASGFLGRLLVPHLRLEHEVLTASRTGVGTTLQIDVTDPASIDRALQNEVDLVIHGAGLVDVVACERDAELAQLVNVEGSANVARRSEARVLFFSSDYVFDHEGECDEDTSPNPPNVYGATKRAGEEEVLNVNDGNLVVRLPFLYGVAPGASRFVDRFRGDNIEIPHPMSFSPLYAIDVAKRLTDLLECQGIIHFPGGTALTRLEFFRQAAASLNVTPRFDEVDPMTLWPRRPASSVFVSKRLPFTGRDVESGLLGLEASLAADR